MSEEISPIDALRTLDLLEDPMLSPLARSQYYKSFLTALDGKAEMTPKMLDRLLAVCVDDLENGKNSIGYVLKIIQSVLKRITVEGCCTLPNLVPTILALLHVMKTSALINKIQAMQTLCFATVLSFPNETLIKIATLHSSEVVEVINLYCHQLIPLEIRVLPCGLLLRLLKILPKEKKMVFVKNNLSVWFSKVIPTTIVCISTLDFRENDTLNLKPLETLESLTDELVPIDYSENPQWLELLENIYSTSKYPSTMKQMLNVNSNKWHRLWIVFIRLLKDQITKATCSQASPINSLLPVVEQAFKMDVTNRCRAFQCWEKLIDNFRTETNDAYTVKRLKLLIIPLKSNNAKVEETALAKLKTWWHLIESYQTKLDDFVEKCLISFLHFCFGRHGGMSPKSSLVSGLLTANTKRHCVEALIELAGHLCCSGCGSLPKLNHRILSITILVEFWNDWMYSLKMAIVVINEDVGLSIQQAVCLWKSFVCTVVEMPENSMRKDLFNELLNVLGNIEKEYRTNNMGKVLFHILISLFDEEQMQVLFKSKNDQGTMHKIILLLLSPSFENFLKTDVPDIVMKLKPVSKYMLENNALISWVLDCPHTQHNISYLLTALAESVCESQYDEAEELTDLMLWPLKPTSFFTDDEYCTKVWVKLVNYMYPNLNPIIKDTFKTNISRNIVREQTYLKFHLCLVVLNKQLSSNGEFSVKDHEILEMIAQTIEDFKYVKENLKTLVNIVQKLVDKMKNDVNSAFWKIIPEIVVNLLRFINPMLHSSIDIDKDNEKLYAKLLLKLKILFKSKEQYPLVANIIEELVIRGTEHVLKYPSLKNPIYNIMDKYASDCEDEDPVLNKVLCLIVRIEALDLDNKVRNEAFVPPETKSVTKKGKKNKTTIVNTVVENGEKFEVIKSNWKFNPKKLTENQKEKLQRKREDIPALYQDLSQSQDNFQLSTWKTDSQDSSTTSKSTTNSKSASSGNVSEILKNIQSSDVVPKIIENLFSENKDVDNRIQEKPVNDSAKKLKKTKDPKSPRMALKDRVFRNVRNLIEKSGVQKDAKDSSESVIQVEIIPKSPTSKGIDTATLVNSASPNLGVERPARLKRKPKKFDDVQIFSLKKSRRSSSLTDSQYESPVHSPVSGKDSEDPEPSTHSMDVEPPITDNISEIDKQTSPHTNRIENVDPISDDSTSTFANKSTDAVDSNNSPQNNVLADIQQENNKAGKESLVGLHAVDTSDITQNKQISSPRSDKKEKITDTSQKSSSDDLAGIGDKVDELSTNEIPVNKDAAHKNDLAADDQSDIAKSNNKNIKTPKQVRNQEIVEPRSGKRNGGRKSRIEKELAIDTVEGHPFLKIQTEKRITRKNVNLPVNTSRRRSLAEKLNKSKVDSKTPSKTQSTSLKNKETVTSSQDSESVSINIGESQEKHSDITDDQPYSEDIIESSQDSTFTTISVKPCKPALKKLSVVVNKIPIDLLPEINSDDQSTKTTTFDNKDDSELPQNKTAATDKTDLDLTENMDTQPVDYKAIEEDQNLSDVIIINDDEEPIVISSESQQIAEADTQPVNLGSETQEIAEADTQPTPPNLTNEICLKTQTKATIHIAQDNEVEIRNEMNTEDDITTTINESMDVSAKPDDENTVSSPFKDDVQRKKDFLDNTLEISPIKTLSPLRDKKSPSPETSSDYVLIKLSSPVQSNGEPFEKCDSPEIFTEDKVSPDKRDLSPPRGEVVVTNTSPSSSLSLKKNRPQVRSGGRAAQMLGLCVPDRLQSMKTSERSEPEEPKKSSPSNTPARRNLRILYNSVGVDNNENSEENEDSENFLKFKKMLPTSDCSPSGPILKRKIAEITDDATVSPASKRKRVSFHDPPVSTTIAVQKYIEPCGIRSPQNSVQKRQERQNLRALTVLSKSPKRLDSVFKLDTVLTKAVESFTEPEQSSSDITQSMSLDETPAVEIVKTSDLNNIDPICPNLVGCTDPIDAIALELSSATMKSMLLKELEGKISTIGDLAKMTELEVNRLCIKAPKVNVARKVLLDYAAKIAITEIEPIETTEIAEDTTSPEERAVEKLDNGVQTNEVVTSDIEIQTANAPVAECCVQTDERVIATTSAQTDESGAKTTKVIYSCLAERSDFVENLCEHLEESSKQRIAENLPANLVTDIFMKNVTSANSKALITQILQKQNRSSSSKAQNAGDLSYIQDYVCDRFDSSDLIMFCSQLLAKINSKPT